MPKKCAKCQETKEFQAFDRMPDSKKYQEECRQCGAEATAQAMGLPLEPPKPKVPSMDAERARRQERYRILKRGPQS